jgi:hypothetical protein
MGDYIPEYGDLEDARLYPRVQRFGRWCTLGKLMSFRRLETISPSTDSRKMRDCIVGYRSLEDSRLYLG